VEHAGAGLAQRGRCRRLEQQRLAPAANPLRVRVLQQIIEGAAAGRRDAHPRQARDHLAFDVPSLEVSPGGDQDLVREELLQLAVEPRRQVEVAQDRARCGEDSDEPGAVVRIDRRRIRGA